MYKTIFTIAIIVFTLIPDIMSQNTQTDRELLQLKGDVKLYRHTRIQIFFRMRLRSDRFVVSHPDPFYYENRGEPDFHITFNRQGNILEKLYGNVKTLNEYDAEGRILLSETEPIENKDISESDIPTGQGSSKVVSVIKLPPFSKITYLYNDKGQLIEKTDKYGNSKDSLHILCTTKYTYITDSDIYIKEETRGNQIRRETYDRYHNMICYEEGTSDKEETRDVKYGYEYDDKGNMLKIETIYDTTTYTYDKSGNITSYSSGEGEGRGTTAYTYDRKGRRLQERIYVGENKRLTAITNYKFDKKGKRLSEITTSTDIDGNQKVYDTYIFNPKTKTGIAKDYKGQVMRIEKESDSEKGVRLYEERYLNGKLTSKGYSIRKPRYGACLETEYTEYKDEIARETIKTIWEYDTTGNIIKKDLYANGELESTDKYEIVYFD